MCRRTHRTTASSTPATPPARNAADGPARSTSQASSVAALLSEFTHKDREFVELYFGEGLDPDEVARRMGISVKTVYSKKHKIQRRLADLLSGPRLAA